MYIFYAHSTSPFGLATFQLLSGHPGLRRPYNLVNSTGAEVNTQGSFGSVPDDGVSIRESDICEFPRITVVFLFE